MSQIWIQNDQWIGLKLKNKQKYIKLEYIDSLCTIITVWVNMGFL